MRLEKLSNMFSLKKKKQNTPLKCLSYTKYQYNVHMIYKIKSQVGKLEYICK